MAVLLEIVAPSACPLAAVASRIPSTSRPPSAADEMPAISLAAASGDGDLEALAGPAAGDGDVEVLSRPAAADDDVEVLVRPAAADDDVEVLSRPAAADDNVEVLARPAAADDDVEVLARPAARDEAERRWLRRIKIRSPASLFRRVFGGVARAGGILGGACRRSFVACYIVKFTARSAATYRRSAVAVCIAKFSSRCARSWLAVGVVFNPLPAGTQLLPVSDSPERLFFVLDMERLQLLAFSVLVLGTFLFISLEVLVLAGVITRYEQYCGILKFVFTILQRLMVAYNKACDFYNNIEWLRMDIARDQQLHPPHVGEQQQQLPPPATEQQQLPPLAAEQQQLPAHATEQQLLPPPLPPEMDIC